MVSNHFQSYYSGMMIPLTRMVDGLLISLGYNMVITWLYPHLPSLPCIISHHILYSYMFAYPIILHIRLYALLIDKLCHTLPYPIAKILPISLHISLFLVPRLTVPSYFVAQDCQPIIWELWRKCRSQCRTAHLPGVASSPSNRSNRSNRSRSPPKTRPG